MNLLVMVGASFNFLRGVKCEMEWEMKGDIIKHTYSLLESGTFCRALFIICIPKPETLPTNIAVRPIIPYCRTDDQHGDNR